MSNPIPTNSLLANLRAKKAESNATKPTEAFSPVIHKVVTDAVPTPSVPPTVQKEIEDLTAIAASGAPATEQQANRAKALHALGHLADAAAATVLASASGIVPINPPESTLPPAPPVGVTQAAPVEPTPEAPKKTRTRKAPTDPKGADAAAYTIDTDTAELVRVAKAARAGIDAFLAALEAS